MKNIILVVIWAIFVTPLAWGENSESDSSGDFTKLNTQYGLVEYQTRSSIEIKVNGETIYEPEYDFLEKSGDFKLSNEEVVLFHGGPTYNDGTEGELFFLVLKQNQKPKIVVAPINPQVNSIKKAWQEKDVVYVDFEDTYYSLIKSPIKLVSDNVVAEKKDSPSSLKSDDCLNLYRMTKDYCSTMTSDLKLDCAHANADEGITSSRVDMDNFRFFSSKAAFNKQKYNESCLAWCKGKDVSYGQFSKGVCNIKK
jgi:hypothetical protein